MSKKKKPKPHGPRIACWDIETSLMTVQTFTLTPDYIDPDDILKDWEIISFALMWLDTGEIVQYDLRDGDTYRNRKKLLVKLRDELEKSDGVVTQNGKRFDWPRARGKFKEYGIRQPSPFRHTDLIDLKKKMGLTSKKLAYTSKKFGCSIQKSTHKEFPGKSLWKECEKGNQKAWKEMAAYNITDTKSQTEEYKLLQEFDTHMRFNTMYNDEQVRCDSCGSHNLHSRGTYKKPTGGWFPRYQCQDCGGWMFDPTTNLQSKKHRKISLKKAV